ncbi:MAG TPA: MotA/TolQ/ExbB proton channel family protein [Myxococcales bacterium LLY-WYZ-16_1]|nr:MotA/TolQ/ExbB proton channel family protein [Myxococcales bacterium LLY-WYZ-16_1]
MKDEGSLRRGRIGVGGLGLGSGILIAVLGVETPAWAQAEGSASSGTELLRRARERRAGASTELERATRAMERARTEGLEAIEAAREARKRAEAAHSRAQQALEALEARNRIPVDEQARRLERRQRRLWVGTSTGGAMPADPESFGRSVEAALERRLDALRASSRVRRGSEPVMARNGQVREVPVLRLGAAMAIAGGSDPETSGFVIPSKDPGGLPRVSGVPFDEEQRADARAVARGSAREVPLDIDGTLARTDAPVARTFLDRLEAGGVFVWPILAVGLLGLLLSTERIAFFWKDRTPRVVLERLLAELRRGRAAAVRDWSSDGRTTLKRIAREAVDTPDPETRDALLETALLREEPAVQRGLGIIAACAGIAPLLGLLGTVTGMISTFDVITVHGTGNPRLLSGGISVALVTTQVGLIVAVPLVLLHAVLSRTAQRKGSDLEAMRSALLEQTGVQGAGQS